MRSSLFRTSYDGRLKTHSSYRASYDVLVDSRVPSFRLVPLLEGLCHPSLPVDFQQLMAEPCFAHTDPSSPVGAPRRSLPLCLPLPFHPPSTLRSSFVVQLTSMTLPLPHDLIRHDPRPSPSLLRRLLSPRIPSLRRHGVCV